MGIHVAGLDALLQWMGPNIADEGLLSDFARIYSSAIQQQLLPVDNFFELSDFCMLAEMECECSELPVEDVIECLQIIKSRPSTLHARKTARNLHTRSNGFCWARPKAP
jgi:hypothetical protein